MIYLDSFIRFSGVGLMLMLVVLSVRDIRASKSALYLFLSCITVTAAFLGHTPEYLRLPELPFLVARFAAIPHLVFVWLFALSLFQLDFSLRPFHLIFGGIYCIPILIIRLYQFEVIGWIEVWVVYFSDTLSLVLIGHLIISTLRGRSDDLLKKRRASRIYFVVVIAFVAITAALGEAVLIEDQKEFRATLWVATIWPGIVWTCYWLFTIRTDVLTFGNQANFQSTQVSLSARDQGLVDALQDEVVAKRAYLEHGLTIDTLAKRLAVTPHRMRSLINKTLGHQNFSTYINAHRIDAIKLAFAESVNAEKPILSIVNDYGFNSLSPFNRAFRAKEGMTPSEFRQRLKRDESVT